VLSCVGLVGQHGLLEKGLLLLFFIQSSRTGKDFSDPFRNLPCKCLLFHIADKMPSERFSEADREKINHFLRKFILFFVSLFVTLFHFLKSDVTVAFYFTNYI
jgi:hypothetical protein